MTDLHPFICEVPYFVVPISVFFLYGVAMPYILRYFAAREVWWKTAIYYAPFPRSPFQRPLCVGSTKVEPTPWDWVVGGKEKCQYRGTTLFGWRVQFPPASMRALWPRMSGSERLRCSHWHSRCKSTNNDIKLHAHNGLQT
jgi:hypothetical protein